MVRLTSIVYVGLLLWWQTKEAAGFLAFAAAALEIGIQILGAATLLRELMKADEKIDFDEHRTAAVFVELEHINNHIAKLDDDLKTLIEGSILKEMSEKMAHVQDVVDYVNSTYNNFVELTQTETCLVGSKLKKIFAHDILNYQYHNLDSLMNEMHDSFIKPGYLSQQSLADLILKDKKHLLMCNRMQSNQHIILQIYKAIIITDMKALALRLAAWDIILEKDAEDNNKVQRLEANEHKNFEERIKNLDSVISEKLKWASRDVWRCDPNEYEQGKSYSKLQQIFQTVIINEKDTDENTCGYGTCEELYVPKEKKNYYRPFDFYFSIKQKRKLHCDGYITDCSTANNKLEYCAAHESDDRRYLGVTYDEHKYGEKFTQRHCETHRRFGALEYYMTVSLVGYKCKYCVCTCASTNLEVDRYFSLEPVLSDTSNRKVITGARLRLVNNIFYFEIREGILQANASIKPGSTSWTDASKKEKVDFEIFIAKDGSNNFEVIPKNDQVFAVQWEQKIVLLDDIDSTSNVKKVLTGLKFDQHNGALYLRVRLSTFQYENGMIDRLSESEGWSATPNYVDVREEVELSDADNPIYMKNPVTTTGKYVTFRITSRQKNMGQFTIPFIDTQEVAPEPPTALSGAGLHHKGTMFGESGGFLGLKVFQFPADS